MTRASALKTKAKTKTAQKWSRGASSKKVVVSYTSCAWPPHCYKRRRKCTTQSTFLSVTMRNISRLKNSTTGLCNKPFLIWLLIIPPHLKYVTTVTYCTLQLTSITTRYVILRLSLIFLHYLSQDTVAKRMSYVKIPLISPLLKFTGESGSEKLENRLRINRVTAMSSVSVSLVWNAVYIVSACVVVGCSHWGSTGNET